MKTLIKNALVHDSINPKPYEADILIEDGKIALIEKVIECADAEIVDSNPRLGLYPNRCRTVFEGKLPPFKGELSQGKLC